MTVTYLSIDPGQTNGVCGYDNLGNVQFSTVVSLSHLVKFLFDQKTIEKCIYEQFKLYPNKAAAQTYSEFPAVKAIGKIEAWAELNEIQLIKQGAHIKATGYKFMGKKPPSKNDPRIHTYDAHAHAVYYFVSNGIINAMELLKNG